MKTTSTVPLLRAEKFTRVADFIPALTTALQKNRLATEDIFLTFRNLVSLECRECHTVVPGEELYLLNQPIAGESVNPVSVCGRVPM